jgi:hypothetical protein
MTTTQDELLPAAEVAEGAPAERVVITRPGLYDLSDEEYHGDPVPGGSASSSTLRLLLPPTAPAIVKYEKDHGRPPKAAFDLGHAFHKLVLGRGSVLKVVEREDGKTAWDTNAVKAEVEAVRAAGHVPLKRAELAQAEAMARAVRDHPTAGPLFAPGTGLPERSIFWSDGRTGAACRAMIDWLSIPPGLPPMIVDLKSTEKPSLRSVLKSMGEYGYYMQDPWYRDAVASLGYDVEDIDFVFCFVGTKPPHLITLFRLDVEDLIEGRERNREAFDLWLACTESGVWPGYSEEIQTGKIPPYALRH